MVGIEPEILVSGIDEESEQYRALSPSELVVALAIVKAHTVANTLIARGGIDDDLIVIGCDSTFEFEGKSLGKPGTIERSIERSRLVQGRSGVLHTGHCLILLRQGSDSKSEEMQEYADLASTRVHFAAMSEGEIASYATTGEPLNVAGGFTLDGLSAPFIRAIEGDWSNVIGLSLPLIKSAIDSFGYRWFEIATNATPHEMGSP